MPPTNWEAFFMNNIITNIALTGFRILPGLYIIVFQKDTFLRRLLPCILILPQ